MSRKYSTLEPTTTSSKTLSSPEKNVQEKMTSWASHSLFPLPIDPTIEPARSMAPLAMSSPLPFLIWSASSWALSPMLLSLPFAAAASRSELSVVEAASSAATSSAATSSYCQYIPRNERLLVGHHSYHPELQVVQRPRMMPRLPGKDR